MKRIERANLSDYTSFRIGGPADLLLEPESVGELAGVLVQLCASGAPFAVIGNGSNILAADEGFRGTVVHIGAALSSCSVQGRELQAGAGLSLAALAREAASAGLSGLEFASGIPGSVGGGVFMNAGAYGGELAAVLTEVVSVGPDGRLRSRRAEDCGFGYRRSIFTENGEIVVSARFALDAAPRGEIEARMRELAQKRTEKQPLRYPSAGSFFKRPEGDFAGRLIEDAGLKGLRVGGAQISDLHAGFVINTGGASCRDVLDLMQIVRETVYDRSGILLQPEVRFLGISTDF